ncbi:hypothetical protein GGX14DRAFT_399159 [Mycena pura]|uniref:Uncharacterized protein n=1 Tax=Mycena pura TaxID=153505 RepID=A0AAD6VBY9_9AGAR|nr:hypothetical protein GGX14DRAFT_399159 [Mycena pura]
MQRRPRLSTRVTASPPGVTKARVWITAPSQQGHSWAATACRRCRSFCLPTSSMRLPTAAQLSSQWSPPRGLHTGWSARVFGNPAECAHTRWRQILPSSTLGGELGMSASDGELPTSPPFVARDRFRRRAQTLSLGSPPTPVPRDSLHPLLSSHPTCLFIPFHYTKSLIWGARSLETRARTTPGRLLGTGRASLKTYSVLLARFIFIQWPPPCFYIAHSLCSVALDASGLPLLHITFLCLRASTRGLIWGARFLRHAPIPETYSGPVELPSFLPRFSRVSSSAHLSPASCARSSRQAALPVDVSCLALPHLPVLLAGWHRGSPKPVTARALSNSASSRARLIQGSLHLCAGELGTPPALADTLGYELCRFRAQDGYGDSQARSQRRERRQRTILWMLIAGPSHGLRKGSGSQLRPRRYVGGTILEHEQSDCERYHRVGFPILQCRNPYSRNTARDLPSFLSRFAAPRYIVRVVGQSMPSGVGGQTKPTWRFVYTQGVWGLAYESYMGISCLTVRRLRRITKPGAQWECERQRTANYPIALGVPFLLLHGPVWRFVSAKGDWEAMICGVRSMENGQEYDSYVREPIRLGSACYSSRELGFTDVKGDWGPSRCRVADSWPASVVKHGQTSASAVSTAPANAAALPMFASPVPRAPLVAGPYHGLRKGSQLRPRLYVGGHGIEQCSGGLRSVIQRTILWDVSARRSVMGANERGMPRWSATYTVDANSNMYHFLKLIVRARSRWYHPPSLRTFCNFHIGDD